MNEWLDLSTLDALTQTLGHSLWQGVFIVSTLILLEHFRVFKSPQKKYMAYLCGLIIMGMAALLTFAILTYPDIQPDVRPVIADEISAIQVDRFSAQAPSARVNFQAIVAMSWFAGFVVFLLVHAAGFFRLLRIQQLAFAAPDHWVKAVDRLRREAHIRNFVHLIASDETQVPFVFGILRPVIVFPANYFTQLTPAELEAILIHELAHIGRNDFLLNIVQIIVESLLFFNPATWWLSREIRRQREYCCDDKVWSTRGKRTYLEALYKVARISTQSPGQALALFNNHSDLIMRVKRISAQRTARRNVRALGFATFGLLTVSLLFAFQTIEGIENQKNPQFENSELRTPADEGDDVAGAFDAVSVFTETSELYRGTPLSVVEPVVYAPVADTVPPTTKTVEQIKREIEEKAREIEALSEELEESIEQHVEVEVEQIERLAEEIELKAESIEEEYENAPEIQQIEVLSERIEERAEQLEDEIEEINEARIEEIERRMEAKAERFENYGSLSKDEQAKLEREMLALTEELNAEMEGIRKEQEQLMNDPEFVEMQNELARLRKQMTERQMDLTPVHAEIAALQKKLDAQHRALQAQLEAHTKGIQEQIILKQEELNALNRELYEAMRAARGDN